MRFLTVEEVLEIHAVMILNYGGTEGIRDMGLLLSAVEMPKAMIFGEYLHPSVFDKAAAYLFHLCCNHPFLDGNKRTSAASALTFLDMNACNLQCNEKGFEELVVSVARGETDKKAISRYFEDNCLREQH